MSIHMCLRERAGSDGIPVEMRTAWLLIREKSQFLRECWIKTWLRYIQTKNSLFLYIRALDVLFLTHGYARSELPVTWLCFVASAAFVFGALILFLETVKPCWLTFGKTCECVYVFCLCVCMLCHRPESSLLLADSTSAVFSEFACVVEEEVFVACFRLGT